MRGSIDWERAALGVGDLRYNCLTILNLELKNEQDIQYLTS